MAGRQHTCTPREAPSIHNSIEQKNNGKLRPTARSDFEDFAKMENIYRRLCPERDIAVRTASPRAGICDRGRRKSASLYRQYLGKGERGVVTGRKQ
jgi:hypothetical protein